MHTINGIEIFDGDILLVSKRLPPSIWFKDLLKLPLELLKLSSPSIIKDFCSFRIQKDSLSIWNHAEIFVNTSTSDVLQSVGAHPEGVRLSNTLESYPYTNYRLAVLRPKTKYSDEIRKKVAEKALSFVGRKYSFYGILKLRISLTFRGFDYLGELTMSKESPEYPVFCSQLADIVWSEIEDILPSVKDFPSPGSFDLSDKLETVVAVL